MAKTTNHQPSKGQSKKRLSKDSASPLTAQHEEQGQGLFLLSSSDGASKKKKLLKHSSERNPPRSKKSQKRARREAQEDLEEEKLTNLLFGDGAGEVSASFDSKKSLFLEDSTTKVVATNKDSDNTQEKPFTFQIDRTGQEDEDSSSSEVAGKSEPNPLKRNVDSDDENDSDFSEDHNRDEGDAPAWEDPDDGATTTLVDASYRLRKLRRSREETEALSSHELEQRLRERYEDTAQGAARTDWAKTSLPPKGKRQITSDDDTDDEGSEDEALTLFNTSKSLLASSRNRLPPNILNIIRCPDANQADPNKAVVRAVNFHPGSDPEQPLMLTAGLDKNLRFFQIGEEKSKKIHGIHFPKMPIYSASFLGNTGKVVLSGRRNFFYFYDAVAGKVDLVPRILGREERSWEKHAVSPDGQVVAFVGNDGYVVLVDTHSKQWIGNLKLNGSVRAITFSPDGSEILASGSDGDIYRWDLKSRRCLERFPNGDGTITSSLSASFKNLAVGAESGVVNLYSEHQRQSMLGSIDKAPLKSIMNLHTSADCVRFNTDGQILAMSTQREKDSLKLLHVPSQTVFSNWPTSKTPLGYVWSLDFSPQSKFLAIGNDKGKCLLYKLKHYNE
ncbi:WD40 repeat-containing protein [Nitzschia inconspicua]|uniref:WD40 repeat-containing protein n=1 Tax=Nitzschia inconspicua TaxID=303405 RepID=A0A9K3LUV0_9STRA|nr:WD40 repeat-containing protein [Nitzschia inconspicua]